MAQFLLRALSSLGPQEIMRWIQLAPTSQMTTGKKMSVPAANIAFAGLEVVSGQPMISAISRAKERHAKCQLSYFWV